MEDEALLSHNRPGSGERGIPRDPIHEVVVVTGIVVKDDKGLDPRLIGEPHALLPGRVAPIPVGGVFPRRCRRRRRS